MVWGRDSAAGHHQLDESPGLLQNAYGLLVRDVAVQRLTVDRQDLVALLKAAIPATETENNQIHEKKQTVRENKGLTTRQKTLRSLVNTFLGKMYSLKNCFPNTEKQSAWVKATFDEL